MYTTTRTSIVWKCRITGCSEAEGHRRALILLAQPHELEELPVRWLDREMEEAVGQIDLSHGVPTAKDFLHCVQILHLEVLVAQVTVKRAKV